MNEIKLFNLYITNLNIETKMKHLLKFRNVINGKTCIVTLRIMYNRVTNVNGERIISGREIIFYLNYDIVRKDYHRRYLYIYELRKEVYYHHI